ncbi:MFS transporter [Streptomyces sp. PR69]|uniref:MFS transporter n=1 Tax=Streptomyces sp. PR69 TaxID=2984950 RepID=UPI002264F798|nr:MFS transporter [Streptomyces sp. PR69]
MKGYAELLRLPGAGAAAGPAALARVAGTMTPLSLLLAMVQSGHSLAVGGGAGAAYALGGAVGGPAIGRAMDRAGPSRVLRLTAPAAGLLLTAVALCVTAAPTAVLLAAACAAGLATAPVGASMRALWPSLTDDPALRQRAYAFEATLSELLFILGPSAVTLLAALAGSRSALLATALLLGAGGLGYGQARAVRRRAGGGAGAPAAPREARPRGPARTAALSVLVAIALTAALSSALAVAVTAFLQDQGTAAEFAGTLIAVQSVGSVAGGLMYGSRTWGGTSYRRYLRLLGVLAAALALLPLVVPARGAGLGVTWAVLLLGGLLLLSGLPLAPAGAEEFQLIGEMTARDKATQAFAGVGSFIAAGGAAGSAVAGLAAEALGPAAALGLPAAFTLAALLVSLAARGPVLAAVAARPEEPAGPRPGTPSNTKEQHA